MGKDYYKILGVEKNASEEHIKTAFRKLAHQYHPDKSGGDEAKFKEINEAYQVLGNKEKRAQYDQFGSTFEQQGGFGSGMNWEDFMRQARGGGAGGFSSANFDFGNLGDIFGDLFGFGAGGTARSRTSRTQGSDISIDFQITLKDILSGVEKEVQLTKVEECDVCGGSGVEPGSTLQTCSDCKGQGQSVRVQQTILGNFRQVEVCHRCGGAGKIPETICKHCRGEGVYKKQTSFRIKIPSGIEDGGVIRVQGKGEAGRRGGGYGDLYVRVHVLSQKGFERHGQDVYTTEHIRFSEAAMGGPISVETLDEVVTLKIPEGTQPGQVFRLKGKGLPALRSASRGDQYITIQVDIPKHLSRKQKKLLEEFEKS